MLTIVIGILIIGCWIVVMIRNNLVYKIRIEAINRLFNAKKYGEWNKIENNPSHGTMIFMLTKWRFENFYPDLEKES